ELSFALQMAEKCHIIEDDSSLLVDDSLIELAKKHDMIIGTIDKELRKKARSEGVPVIYLRQGRRLLLDGKD
ncbi:MAG: nucleotide-binding protein, partial [archaeon]